MKVAGTASHRLVDATVTLVDERGRSRPGAVQLVDADCYTLLPGFEEVRLANDELNGEERERVAVLYNRWLELFNTATLPFYWGRFEPDAGRPDTRRLQAAARWLADRGVAVKGHPAVLAHRDAPTGCSDLTTDEVVAAQVARIRREVDRLRRPHRHVGRDQRGRDHAGVRPRTRTASPGCAATSGGSASSGWRSRRPARPTRRRRCCSTTSTCPPRTSA